MFWEQWSKPEPPPASETPLAIRWCGITRDSVLLCESAPTNDETLSNLIMAKPPTPGFEYATQGRLRAIKLHVHEDPATVWAFHVIIEASFPEERAKALLGQLASWSKPHRATPSWRTGGTLSAQGKCGAELLQLVSRAAESPEPKASVAVKQAEVDEVTQVMTANIELMLARQEKLDLLGRKAEDLNAASKFFYQRTRSFKRHKMWQEARWGIALGTAATVVTGAILLPIIL